MMDWLVLPPNSIIFITALSAVISLAVSLVNKKIVDYDKMALYQKTVKEYMEIKKQHMKTKDKKLERKLKRMEPRYREAQAELSKMSLKPMMYTTLPILIMFFVLAGIFVEIPLAKLPFPFPFMGYFHGRSVFQDDVIGYIGLYMIASIFFSNVFMKLLGLSPTPS